MKGPPPQDDASSEPSAAREQSAARELDALDYYTLLGVAEDATRADIRAAFRRFALRYHPDRFAGQSEALATRALTIYRRGAEAVDVLCDPQQRRAYDAVLERGEKRLTDDAVAALRHVEPVHAKKPPQAPPPQATPAKPPAPKPAPEVATFSKPGAGVRASRPRPPRASKPSKRAMPAVSAGAAPLSPPPKPAAAVAPKPAAAPTRALRIQSPQARAFFERANEAKAKGDLRGAWRMLKAAVEAEPDNAALESELYAVERHFRP